MNRPTLRALALPALLACAAAQADPINLLFVGNSYTFGRTDPVMSYNAANVTDLTAPMAAANAQGSNAFEPHPWGGVAGIFKQFTVQVGLDYNVSLSTRNAASLRGHFLNSNPANWDLRGNIASQTWDKVVLQEQSDEALPKQTGLSSNPAYTTAYVNLIENYLHGSAAVSYRERELIGGTNAECAAITGASTGTCGTLRTFAGNPNASAATQVYLYQTWARPNLVNAPFTTVTDPVMGEVSFTTTPATSYYPSLQAMTDDLVAAYATAAAHAGDDQTGGITAIAPVGQAFMRAIEMGFATPDHYASGAATDGLMDLWWDDGTHASRYGSYLSALTLFGTLTGVDPALLGAGETAARELGIAARDAELLQRVASLQLGFGLAGEVPEPGSLALCAAALATLVLRRRRGAGAARPSGGARAEAAGKVLQ